NSLSRSSFVVWRHSPRCRRPFRKSALPMPGSCSRDRCCGISRHSNRSPSIRRKWMSNQDWKIFRGRGEPHDGLDGLPDPPPWRFARAIGAIGPPDADLDLKAAASKATTFLPSDAMIIAVNTALYLRRPLLLTGRPGTGKSTLISKVAYELKLGPVLKWSVS